MKSLYELIELAARPVLEAMPDRVAADSFYHPDFTDEEVRALGPLSGDPADLPAEVERHTALAHMLVNTPFGEKGELNEIGMKLFSLFLRGSVRAALSGVFTEAPLTADIRCYADGELALLWSIRPDGGIDFSVDDFTEFSKLILEYLPGAPDGVSETVRIFADEQGLIDQWQDDKVGAVVDFLARDRTGTTLLDLFAFGGLCSEYPDHAMVIVDNDLGRHLVMMHRDSGGRRELALLKSSELILTTWLRRSVE